MKQFPVLAPDGETVPESMMLMYFGVYTADPDEFALLREERIRRREERMRSHPPEDLGSLTAAWHDGSVSLAWKDESKKDESNLDDFRLPTIIENIGKMERQPWKATQQGPSPYESVELRGPEGARLELMRCPNMGVTILKLRLDGWPKDFYSWRIVAGPYPTVPVLPNMVLLPVLRDDSASLKADQEGDDDRDDYGEREDDPEG